MTSPSVHSPTLIKGGLLFDGNGGPGLKRDIGIADGVVRAISAVPMNESEFDQVIDAHGMWVVPGFLDVHSHYDAEIVISPGLPESVRHGVTTVVLGNCSLSMVTVGTEDSADLFARVEAIPYRGIKQILERKKEWATPGEYRSWLERQPLGPNVAAMLGHSDLRVGVLGLERATRRRCPPSPAELETMCQVLQDALDNGFLGLSTMTAQVDKLAGDRAWSKPLPSTFASWREFRMLHKVLRRGSRVLQSAPNPHNQANILAFILTSSSLGVGRRPLRTSLLTAMDLKAHRMAHLLTRLVGHVANRILRGDLRWQVLPGPMTVFAEGVQFASFEEFGTGATLRDLRTAEDQYALLREPVFRKQFVKDMSCFVMNGFWHRRFDDAVVLDCPDDTVVGRTFEDLGRERGRHPAEVFLDLAVDHQDMLRWKTILGNHRPRIVEQLLASPVTQIGFADSGAHLRNIAFYNFGLRALALAKRAQSDYKPFLTIGQMVRKLTSDLADWWGVDAGRIAEGRRADLVVIDPDGLDDQVFETTEAPGPDDYRIDRVVNRNDSAVSAVLINGHPAYTRDGGHSAGLGTDTGFGRFLPSTHAAH